MYRAPSRHHHIVLLLSHWFIAHSLHVTVTSLLYTVTCQCTPHCINVLVLYMNSAIAYTITVYTHLVVYHTITDCLHHTVVLHYCILNIVCIPHHCLTTVYKTQQCMYVQAITKLGLFPTGSLIPLCKIKMSKLYFKKNKEHVSIKCP